MNKKHDVILIAHTRVKNRLSPRSASLAANKVKRRAASALFVATVDLTLAHAADTLRASAASSAFARASRTNIAGTRVRDRGSMARCEGEVGAGGDDDVTLTLADKSPDDSEVRRRVEERGSVVSRSIRRSAARARPLSHSCPSTRRLPNEPRGCTFWPHPSFFVSPLRACASSGSRGETCVRVAIWRVDARDAWGFRVCALVFINGKVPAPRVRVLQSEKRGRRAERQKFGTQWHSRREELPGAEDEARHSRGARTWISIHTAQSSPAGHTDASHRIAGSVHLRIVER